MWRIGHLVGSLITIGTAVTLQNALAADMPAKAPPHVVPAVIAAPNWTGIYIGAAGGYGWGQAEQTDASPFSSGKYDTTGGVIGGTIGYSWQSGAVVVGLETDLSYANITGSTIGADPASGNCLTPTNPHCESTIAALGTVRGRIGYAWRSLLPYVTGGLAYGKINGSEGVASMGGSDQAWAAGWTAGVGIEAALAPNWSAKIEYLYVDLGNPAVFNDIILGISLAENLRTTASVVRLGVNYRFGSL